MTDIASDAGFLADFAELGRFGATSGGGVDRQAASSADADARDWFVKWLRGHAFQVEVDAIGNIFGLIEFVPGAPYALIGSHLDSQPLAGRYDGAYGVLAAAYAAARHAQALRESGEIPKYNVAVVDWFNEEGSRFKPSMMGSAVRTGLMDLDVALDTRDRAGTTVREALDAINGRGGFDGPDIAAYAEIHVEQGHDLEDSQTTIGVVESTWSARKLRLRVNGEQGHTGASPMGDRRDALLGASLIVVSARELVAEYPEEALHTAVSEIDVLPNSPVTIARQADLLVDLRAPDETTVADAERRLLAQLPVIEQRARVKVDVLGIVAWSSGPFEQRGLLLVEASAAQRGLSSRRTSTLAGHDATNLKKATPTVLVFVPSVGGVSHNERERTKDADMLAGLTVLTDVLGRLAAGALDDGTGKEINK